MVGKRHDLDAIEQRFHARDHQVPGVRSEVDLDLKGAARRTRALSVTREGIRALVADRRAAVLFVAEPNAIREKRAMSPTIASLRMLGIRR